MLALVFMRAEEPSSAQSEGLCYLYRVLEDTDSSGVNGGNDKGTTQARQRFKANVGKGILKPLFDFFVVGGPEMALAQRWAGLFLWELLEAKINAGRLLMEIDSGDERYV